MQELLRNWAAVQIWKIPPACFKRSGRTLLKTQIQNRAFTLIELLVVIGTLAVLAAVLAPALAGSRTQSKITACTANFRQWAVSVNLYAADYRDSLPRFDWTSGGGGYLWDVSPVMVTNLAPYGLTVPMWFCPFRPNEFDIAEATYGRPINTIQDLQAAFDYNPYNECIMCCNWWVPRTGFPSQPTAAQMKNWATEPIWMQGPIRNGQLIKNADGTLIGTPVGKYGYPYKLHLNAAAHVPFISDKACSSTIAGGYGMGATVPPASGVASADPNDICPNTAHFVNGVLLGVNAAYADGHVEMHSPANMLCGYGSAGSSPYWFY